MTWIAKRREYIARLTALAVEDFRYGPKYQPPFTSIVAPDT